MFEPFRQRSRVYVVEMRTGSGITRRISRTKPQLSTYGIVEPIFQSEIDLSDAPCESEVSQQAYEELIRKDRIMESRFARLLAECACGREEVAV